ncbi:MAG: DUF3014 domain-containing protein [Polaromonas sp.]|nr:DUF3014 domain-containing protein [Polaromonas sp.]
MKYTQKTFLLPIAVVSAGVAIAVIWWLMAGPKAPLTANPDVLPMTEMTASENGALNAPALPALAAASAPADFTELQPVEVPVAALPLGADQVSSTLTDFLGKKAALTFFQLDDFPRKFVATVDNLGRTHAPPVAWPIGPTDGRFTVQTHDGATIVSSDNGLRYTPLVLLLESINIPQAVDVYVRMYPVLQKTYGELGFPNRQFNDRLLQVINHLLATPIAPQVMAVQLTEVKGPIPSLRPWVRYEFADPALETLSAGQKIMLRVGSVNQNRLKARLSAVRQEILKRSTQAR